MGAAHGALGFPTVPFAAPAFVGDSNAGDAR
jgi:hypothetical protein